MWEAATGKEMWHGARQGTVAFSPDGKTLVSGGWDQCLTFQDAATGAVRFSLKEQRDLIDGIAFSPDGRSLATCHHRGTVYLRDPKTGEIKKTLQGHKEVAWSISFAPDSKWLASSGDETVRVWDVTTGCQRAAFDWKIGRVHCVALSPDGRSNWSKLIGSFAQAVEPDPNRAGAFSEIVIHDGTILVVRDSNKQLNERLENLEGQLAWPSISRSVSAAVGSSITISRALRTKHFAISVSCCSATDSRRAGRSSGSVIPNSASTFAASDAAAARSRNRPRRGSTPSTMFSITPRSGTRLNSW